MHVIVKKSNFKMHKLKTKLLFSLYTLNNLYKKYLLQYFWISLGEKSEEKLTLNGGVTQISLKIFM